MCSSDLDVSVGSGLKGQFGKAIRFIDTVKRFFGPDPDADRRIKLPLPPGQLLIPLRIGAARYDEYEAVGIDIGKQGDTEVSAGRGHGLAKSVGPSVPIVPTKDGSDVKMFRQFRPFVGHLLHRIPVMVNEGHDLTAAVLLFAEGLFIEIGRAHV